jgi:CRP/FNR family transcriptional regulator
MQLLPVPADVITRSRLIEAEAECILFAAGEDLGQVFVVETGLLRVDQEIGGPRWVRIAGPGDVIGEESLMGEPYTQRAETLTPVRLIALTLTKTQSDPAVSRWLLDRLSRQLRQNDREIYWMRHHSVTSRVQLHLAELHNKGGGAEIPLTQAEFASVVGATRETISTALNQLKRAEIIGLSRRSITILQPERLGLSRRRSASA